MPINQTAERPIDENFLANEPIAADQFIPHLLHSADKSKLLSSCGPVGRKGFGCSDYHNRFSPYLMLSDLSLGPPLAFPDHPHYGHEMVLYVLEGSFTHEDFTGWKETFQTGDLHWMSTGKGIVHAQIPGGEGNGGNSSNKNRHVQWWINLPKEKKEGEPTNQVLRADAMPSWKEGAMVDIRLLVGKYGKWTSPIKTATPLLMMDVNILKDSWNLKVPFNYMVGIYVVGGKGWIGDNKTTVVQENSIILSKASLSSKSDNDESQLTIKVQEGPLRFLVFAGEPISEAMEFEGFFVCNNKEETKQVIKAFEERTCGFSKGKSWSSRIISSAHQK